MRFIARAALVASLWATIVLPGFASAAPASSRILLRDFTLIDGTGAAPRAHRDLPIDVARARDEHGQIRPRWDRQGALERLSLMLAFPPR